MERQNNFVCDRVGGGCDLVKVNDITEGSWVVVAMFVGVLQFEKNKWRLRLLERMEQKS